MEGGLSRYLGLIELLGFGAFAIGFGLWQLWTLRDKDGK